MPSLISDAEIVEGYSSHKTPLGSKHLIDFINVGMMSVFDVVVIFLTNDTIERFI